MIGGDGSGDWRRLDGFQGKAETSPVAALRNR